MRNLYPLTGDGNYEKHPITSSIASRADRSGTTSIGDALMAIATTKSGRWISSREDDTKYVYFFREPISNSAVLINSQQDTLYKCLERVKDNDNESFSILCKKPKNGYDIYFLIPMKNMQNISFSLTAIKTQKMSDLLNNLSVIVPVCITITEILKSVDDGLGSFMV